MSETLHLALGDSAAGCLSIACRSHGLAGTVLGIRGDPSHGPLDEEQARLDYMRACYSGYDDLPLDDIDEHASWRSVFKRFDQEVPKTIVIWSGDNVSETIFLAMACWQLRKRPVPVLRVSIPEKNTPPYVAFQTPAELADLYPSRQELTGSEHTLLGRDFERIRDETGLLRYWQSNRIIGIPLDHYDHFLLESCAAAWTPAPTVVGSAMARCDLHNLMSDLFFSSRLQALIRSGAIEAEGKLNRLRDYVVRLN